MKDVAVYNEAGTLIGKIQEGALRKEVRRSIHMLRKPVAWAWDKVCIQKAGLYDVHTIEIFDKEEKVTFYVPFSFFVSNSVEFNRGYGLQLYLPLHLWGRK